MLKSPLAAFSLFLITASFAHAEESWPDLSKPARAVGGGEQDAAVVVGIENYFAVPGVPGAKSNAGEWFDYLTETRGVPPQNVKLLTNADATREEILGAADKAAGQAGAGGTLWFVFVGHGAPSADGKDGLLIGVDAQQKAESLQARSVPRGELLKTLGRSPAGSIRVVLDACFSGRGPDGASIAPGLQPLVTVAAMGALDPRMAVLTAAKGNQFAGALPGADRPAFSYLVLGGLRGWAAGADGKVTAGSLWSYTKNALAATVRGRDQTPDLLGAESAVMGSSAGEKGPSLAGLAKATAGGGAGRGFQVTNLPAVPVAQAPKDLGQAASGLDLSKVDVDALEKYDAAAMIEKGDADPEVKARTWRELAADAPAFAAMAGKRAVQWEAYAAQKAAADAAREKRVEARDEDWKKLGRLLALGVVSAKDKKDWSAQFLSAYLKSPGLAPGMAKALVTHSAPGALQESLKRLALMAPIVEKAPVSRPLRSAPEPAPAPKADIQWVRIPGGKFTMGGKQERSYQNALPPHVVTIPSFEMAKTEVTNKQYTACVAAGACTPPDRSYGLPGTARFEDERPVMNVTWSQAKAFAEWAGARLPSESEWEYAAKSAGKDQRYPWGGEKATCERAVMKGCFDEPYYQGAARVCSKPKGNTEQGLCDMAGNVDEYVRDAYWDSYNGAPTDGSALEYKEYADGKVMRGGSHSDAAEELDVTWRNNSASPDYRNPDLGFRLAR